MSGNIYAQSRFAAPATPTAQYGELSYPELMAEYSAQNHHDMPLTSFVGSDGNTYSVNESENGPPSFAWRNPNATNAQNAMAQMGPDGKVTTYEEHTKGFASWLPVIASMFVGGLGAASAMGGAEAGVGLGATEGAGAGGFAIPTSTELAAGGFGTGGMGLTGGAGAIGAAPSLVEAGIGGMAGYGGAGAAAGLGVGGGQGGAVEGLTNSTQGTLGGSAGGAGEGLVNSTQGVLGGGAGGAGPGEGLVNSTKGVMGGSGGGGVEGLTSQTLGTAGTAGSTAGSGLTSTVAKALIPSVLKALTGGTPTGSGGAGSSTGSGGYGGSLNQVANETPGMIAPPSMQGNNTQAIANALLLQNPNQPTFNPIAYTPVQKIADALQQDNNYG